MDFLVPLVTMEPIHFKDFFFQVQSVFQPCLNLSRFIFPISPLHPLGTSGVFLVILPSKHPQGSIRKCHPRYLPVLGIDVQCESPGKGEESEQKTRFSIVENGMQYKHIPYIYMDISYMNNYEYIYKFACRLIEVSLYAYSL